MPGSTPTRFTNATNAARITRGSCVARMAFAVLAADPTEMVRNVATRSLL
jgi:hypothetical protein